MSLNYLQQKVKDLIDTHKEDNYYDFKLEYGSNTDLVHDIICLANAKYDGERYLIIGIRNDYKVIGLEDAKTKKQNQLIDLLAGSKFANGNFPEISLFNVEIDGKTIQIIKIQDRSYKPYFLECDKYETVQGKKEKIIRAGVVYSRVGCRNTPINNSASLYDIEHMWRERFGLDLSPLDRLSIYLLDFENWDNLDSQTWFYKPFPEFTFKETASESYLLNSPWTWFLRDVYAEKTSISLIEDTFFYHTTQIKTTKCIQQYDGIQFKLCLPQVDYIKIAQTGTSEPQNTFYFYYLLKNNFDWILLQFYYFHRKNTKLATGVKHLTDERYHYPKVIKLPIFENIIEKENFISLLKQEIYKLTKVEIKSINLVDNVEKDTACGNWAFNFWIKSMGMQS